MNDCNIIYVDIMNYMTGAIVLEFLYTDTLDSEKFIQFWIPMQDNSATLHSAEIMFKKLILL